MSQSEQITQNPVRGRGTIEPLGRNDVPSRHHDPDIHRDAPRLEPWLGVSLLAIVPMLVAFAVPRSLVIYNAAISGILLVIGVGMLVVQERRNR